MLVPSTPTVARPIKPKPSKREEILGDVLHNKTIIECLYQQSSTPSCKFAVAEFGEAPKIVDSYVIGTQEVHPLQKKERAFRRGIINLPSDVTSSTETVDVLARLTRMLVKYIDLEPFYINLIAHYVLVTWVWDAFGSYGFLRLKGPAGCGKTRVLDVLKKITYRGTHIGVNPTKSALFRMAHNVKGTLLIDECDRQDADLYSGFTQMLNAAYRRDGVVTISEMEKDSWVPTEFEVGGPKILTNRMAFRDHALETRCITIPMVVKQVARHIAPHLPKGFEEEAESMRNLLLRWRFDYFHNIDLNDSLLRHLEPRAREIGLSLFAVSPDEEFRAELIRRFRAVGN
jgi:hypothetical protein